MSLKNPELLFVTELSDEFLHLTRTCIYSFISTNRWFDGTIVLLTHKLLPWTNRGLSQIKTIYPKIEIIDITNDPIIEYINLTNPKIFRKSSEILRLLKIYALTINDKVIYSASHNLFLNNISSFLVEDTLSTHQTIPIFFYKDDNIVLDYNHILDVLAQLETIASEPIEKRIWEFLCSMDNINIISDSDIMYSSGISDKKYNQLSIRVRFAKIMGFNTLLSNSIHNTKINRLWQFSNKTSLSIINRPVKQNKQALLEIRKNMPKRKHNHKPARLRMPSNPKLGATYIVFDGIELLESSIKQIRASVDFLCVVYQTTSWFGARIAEEDMSTLKRLEREGLIDSLVQFKEFKPVSSYSKDKIHASKKYETAKRDLSLHVCINSGCTHYICLDVDEYYDPRQFHSAKQYIYDNNIHYSACKYINYATPVLHRGLSSMYVPFISRITPSSKNGKRFFVQVDPTRGIHTAHAKNVISFNTGDLVMHHMEMVRKNIYRKYESTTRLNLDRDNLTPLADIINSIGKDDKSIDFNRIIYYGSEKFKLIKTKNRFDIPYKQW